MTNSNNTLIALELVDRFDELSRAYDSLQRLTGGVDIQADHVSNVLYVLNQQFDGLVSDFGRLLKVER